MTATPSRHWAAIAIGGVVAATLLTACGPGVPESVQFAEPTTAASAASEPATVTIDVGCEPYADYMGHDGTTVTLFTSVLPPEQQNYEDSWLSFEECSGIDIVYEGSDQFEAQLPTRIAGGNAPDLAWIPQPGLLAKLVEAGGPVPAPQSVVDKVDEYWNPIWKEYGSVGGTLYGAPNSANMKSLVWYSPTIFLDNGYTVPATWDELFSLSDQMVKDGITPWCGGIESGGATGWPATDWLEQIVLRQSGPDVYDRWVSGEVAFDSPEITQAMDTLASWMKAPEYVTVVELQGGRLRGRGRGCLRLLPPGDRRCCCHEPGRRGGRVHGCLLRPRRGAGSPDVPGVGRVRHHSSVAARRVGLRQQRCSSRALLRSDRGPLRAIPD
jgi:alpha-glucoside transport system substrate-binding protein